MSGVGTILPEILLWEQSLNVSCGGRMDCDSVYDLGPPPDLILTLPPPPVPPFMNEFVSKYVAHEVDLEHSAVSQDIHTCSMCLWANGNNVGFVELAHKGPLIDDTWFLVIVSSCVGAILLGIIVAITLLKYREGKLKPLSDNVLAKKEKSLGLERCEAVLYPTPGLNSNLAPSNNRSSRALWAGLKSLEGKTYTVDHCQPVDQKPARLDLLPVSENTYDYADFRNANRTSLSSPYEKTNIVIPRLIPPVNGVSSPAASFENVGYIQGDEKVEAIKSGPDGSIVTRAAFLLGSHKPLQTQHPGHQYEMVSPRGTPSPRRHKSLDRGGPRQPPFISAPTNIGSIRLPPLNCRYDRYTLTALAIGTHTLCPRQSTGTRVDHRFAHVSLDRSGNAHSGLAPVSPSDHIYSSPITSPVI